MQRIDELFNILKSKREVWKQLHPGKDFPGVVVLQVDQDVPGRRREERVPDGRVRGLPERQLHGQPTPEGTDTERSAPHHVPGSASERNSRGSRRSTKAASSASRGVATGSRVGRGSTSRPGSSLSLVVYRIVAGRELEARRTALLGKQRAVEATVGKEWSPLRDRLEKFVIAAAGAEGPTSSSPSAERGSTHVATGVYLRIRLADATSPGDSHAARDSARDAFTGCLLRDARTRPLARGEPDAGAFPEQPWNLGRPTRRRASSPPEWVGEVKSADDSLRLRVFEQQYDKAEREEIPKAIDIMKRADFFLLVLDEAADDPKTRNRSGRTAASTPRRKRSSSRRTGRECTCSTSEGQGDPASASRARKRGFVFAGGKPVTDEETLDAMKRQVNNCALAQQVRSARQCSLLADSMNARPRSHRRSPATRTRP